MRHTHLGYWFLVTLVLTALLSQDACPQTVRKALAYAPAPIDNPLKGLVPYARDVRDRFPHSMEFNYLAMAPVVTAKDTYDWTPVENLLNDIASRGHQAVLRFYLEYPGKPTAIPAYLLKQGLKVHRYTNTNTAPFPPDASVTPNYEDKDLRECIQNFIQAFGKKYDGDPRIGFITAGILGSWGEWHTYPRNELWASKTVQNEVLDAYETAFKTTPILLRYPAREGHYSQTANAQRRFGYHDDSFAWATVDTGKKEDNWFFIPLLTAAKASQKWKSHPIGGEIRPEAWGIVFDPEPSDKKVQNFAECVTQTHVTWLMDSGMFRQNQSESRRKVAEQQVRRMGYELHISEITLQQSKGKLGLTLNVVNRGVAPFYYPWKTEYALLSETGNLVKQLLGNNRVNNILPDNPPSLWKETLDFKGVRKGTYHLALRVPNPLPNGKPLKFANQTQDQHREGWLSLSSLSIP